MAICASNLSDSIGLRRHLRVNCRSQPLVLTGGIHSDATTDHHALRWHVGLWDLWFLVWGVATMRAARRYRRVLAPPGQEIDESEHHDTQR